MVDMCGVIYMVDERDVSYCMWWVWEILFR